MSFSAFLSSGMEFHIFCEFILTRVEKKEPEFVLYLKKPVKVRGGGVG